MATTPLTTLAQIQRELGDDAVVDWSDHDEIGSNDIPVIDEAIDYASDTIVFELAGIYEEADLAMSTLVGHWATILACCFLTNNRGNDTPQSLQAQCDKVMEALEKVRLGRPIPGINTNGDFRPTMSNRTVDRRYSDSSVRIRRRSSTSPETSTQGRNFYENYNTLGE